MKTDVNTSKIARVLAFFAATALCSFAASTASAHFVEGHVYCTDSTGCPATPTTPLADIPVTATGEQGNVETGTTDSNGFFHIDLPEVAENYKLTITLTPPMGVQCPAEGFIDFFLDPNVNMGQITGQDFAVKNCNPGCHGTIGDFVWQDDNQDGCQNPGEPGIPGVVVDLFEGCPPEITFISSTTTNSDGKYLFSHLCAGTYTISFHKPTGYRNTLANQGCDVNGEPSDETDSDCDCEEGTEKCQICVTLPSDDSSDLTIDCGYVPLCGLSVVKKCLVPPPPAPSPFACSGLKPIDSLSMIWNGTQTIGIKAWKGAVGSTLLATIDNIAVGQEVTVTGFAGSQNDVYWEIFAGTTAGPLLGRSTFHLSCSDVDMNGPEDCGKAEGNGKGLTGFINDWIFAGMAGNGKVIDCTPPEPEPNDNCTVTNTAGAGCGGGLGTPFGHPTTLTFRYSGGDCSASNNPQNGKFVCSGSVDFGQPVTITTSNGYTITPSVVNPGQTFTVSGSFNAQSFFTMTNSGGTQNLSIHTSCSQLLQVGNIFGGLTLVGFNGQNGGNIIYRYIVTNNGANMLGAVNLSDDKLGHISGPFPLNPGESRTFDVPAQVSSTTQNIATVTNSEAGNECTAVSDPVVVTVMDFCPAVWGGSATVGGKQFKRPISNFSGSTATITGLNISWPAINGRLFKVKLDGDTVWDKKSTTGATSITIPGSALTNDVNHKSVGAHKTRAFTLEFEKNASTNTSLYSGTISFGGTCSLSF